MKNRIKVMVLLIMMQGRSIRAECMDEDQLACQDSSNTPTINVYRYVCLSLKANNLFSDQYHTQKSKNFIFCSVNILVLRVSASIQHQGNDAIAWSAPFPTTKPDQPCSSTWMDFGIHASNGVML